MKEKYVQITRRNITGIRSLLRQQGGHFLIAEPGPQSYQERVIDADLGIYDKPILDSNEIFHVKRGTKKIRGEDWQTNWENDRLYLLREIPKPNTDDPTGDLCRSLFDRLMVGEYEFKIGFQYASGRNIFRRDGRLFYVPQDTSYEPAFRKALSYMIGRMNATNIKEGREHMNLGKSHIDQIVQYAMEDLNTSKVFKHNVGAGLEADAIMF